MQQKHAFLGLMLIGFCILGNPHHECWAQGAAEAEGENPSLLQKRQVERIQFSLEKIKNKDLRRIALAQLAAVEKDPNGPEAKALRRRLADLKRSQNRAFRAVETVKSSNSPVESFELPN